jgi:hypothetical protein
MTGWLRLKNEIDTGKLRSLQQELSEIVEGEREDEERDKEREEKKLE